MHIILILIDDLYYYYTKGDMIHILTPREGFLNKHGQSSRKYKIIQDTLYLGSNPAYIYIRTNNIN